MTTRSAKGKCFSRSWIWGEERRANKVFANRQSTIAGFEHVVGMAVSREPFGGSVSACRIFPAAGRAEPPGVRRAVRSEAAEGRDSAST